MRDVTFTYVCRECGEEVPADEWELAQHSLTHNEILKAQQGPDLLPPFPPVAPFDPEDDQ